MKQRLRNLRLEIFLTRKVESVEKTWTLSGCVLGIVSRHLLGVWNDASSQVLAQKWCEEHPTHNRTGWGPGEDILLGLLLHAAYLSFFPNHLNDLPRNGLPSYLTRANLPCLTFLISHAVRCRGGGWWVPGNRLQVAHDACRYWVFCKSTKCPCTGSQLALHRSLDESVVYLSQLEWRPGLSHHIFQFLLLRSSSNGHWTHPPGSWRHPLRSANRPQDCCISKPLYGPTSAFSWAFSLKFHKTFLKL